MKSFYNYSLLLLISLIILFLYTSRIFGQEENFSRTKIIKEDGKIAFETIPTRNNGEIESIEDHLVGTKKITGDHYVLGGSILWWTDDQGTSSIANSVALNASGDRALTGWTLNNMRASLYSDANNTPLWNFYTGSYDPVVDISSDGSIIVTTAGTDFYLLNSATGIVDYQYTLPDSFYASGVSVARNGSMAVVLANAYGNSTTYRAYGFSLSGTPSIIWTFDVQASEVTNWAGVNISADGSTVAVAGRYHLYVLASVDGSLIWDHFLDNTESAPAISGDGEIVATADNSGFVQTWHHSSASNEYFLLWQYKVPGGTSSSWASSVGISADGSTIVAGSLIFLSSGYDGSVMCFDTYGNGFPKWVFANTGDLVDDIKVSDDGKVAAAATWGDYPAHTKPDLLVFDTQTGDLTFDVVTPGSFFTCDLTPDGKRVFAGGKAVHAREFGNGGRIYLCEIDLDGGSISGHVDLTNTTDDSGVLITAVGTVRNAITDNNGNYLLENLPAGTYTVTAEKPGYNFGNIGNVVVTTGNTTTGIDFTLNPFATPPPTLSASTNLVGTILLNWTSLISNLERQKEIALMVGDKTYDDFLSISGTRSIDESTKREKQVFQNNSKFVVDSIAVYRSQVTGGPYQKIASVSAAQTSYADSNVFALRDYYYVVNIFNDTGQSIYSNEAIGSVSDTLLTFSFDVPETSIPTIDGVLSPGEWDDAFQVDISDIFGYGGGVPQPQGSVLMYLKFDGVNDMLYVAGEDFLNPTLDDNEGFGLYFDDNNNNVFDADPPFVLEGNFWAYWHPGGSDLRFRTIPNYIVDTLQNAQVEFSDVNGHLQGEFAIPMGFMEGYQLQVFGPDKIVGLGAFLIARNAGAAVFNGWWPQTMNTLFNPQYFGDVGINVLLDAPPQAPSNISVTRQGEDLLLAWDDPTLGLNNDPLSVPPIIKVFKNGELLNTFSAGVESYLDNDVYCVGWYEYQFQAFIILGQDTLTGPISNPFGNYACEEPSIVPISYDDGIWDAFYVPSFSWEENKWAVRFTPATYPTYLRKVETTVNGNDAFEFTIQRDNGGVPSAVIAGPYRVNDNDPATVGVVTKILPGLDPPEITGGDFWVVINYLEPTPGAPGIGMDFTPPIDGRTFSYLTSTGWTSFSTGDLMVTAYVSDQPVNVERENNNVLPLTFELKQNYPNPFNPSTVISYQIPQNEMVNLEIYNTLGENVRTLVNEIQNSGIYQVSWDGKNNSGNQLSSGVYLYRLKAGNNVQVMKMVLLR